MEGAGGFEGRLWVGVGHVSRREELSGRIRASDIVYRKASRG